MFFIKYFITSFLIIIILTSCSNEPELNPVLSVYKGTIKGIVYDAKTNSPIYYARISTNPKTIETHTGADGDFILTDVMAGDYMVEAYREGYDSDTEFVTIEDKDTIKLNFSLPDLGEYLDYYPLEIGNYWEYWTPEIPRYSLEVISDTTINNFNYYIIHFKSLPSGNIFEIRYERIDTYNALVYRYFPFEEKEMMIDSLPAKVGQRFSSNMLFDPYLSCYSTCLDIEEQEIFGEIRKVRHLNQDCGQDMPKYSIAKGFGLCSFSFFRVGIYTLKYAIIDSVEYGEKP